jgi:hypothetical protein
MIRIQKKAPDGINSSSPRRFRAGVQVLIYVFVLGRDSSRQSPWPMSREPGKEEELHTRSQSLTRAHRGHRERIRTSRPARNAPRDTEAQRGVEEKRGLYPFCAETGAKGKRWLEPPHCIRMKAAKSALQGLREGRDSAVGALSSPSPRRFRAGVQVAFCKRSMKNLTPTRRLVRDAEAPVFVETTQGQAERSRRRRKGGITLHSFK